MFKPKYKYCLKARNKIYLNKNSKFFNFCFRRRRKRIYYVKTITLLFRNMKWVENRFNLLPRKYKRKRRFIYNYKNLFVKKQLLKKFYGRVKEKEMLKNFNLYWQQRKLYNTNLFLSSFERRLDVLFFRMRLLPTIGNSYQYISHHGIFVNNELIKIPKYKVNIGDIVSIQPQHWNLFNKVLSKKISTRSKCLTIYFLKREYLMYKNYYKLIKKQRDRWSKRSKKGYHHYKRLKYYNVEFKKILIRMFNLIKYTENKTLKKFIFNLFYNYSLLHLKYMDILSDIVLSYARLVKVRYIYAEILFKLVLTRFDFYKDIYKKCIEILFTKQISLNSDFINNFLLKEINVGYESYKLLAENFLNESVLLRVKALHSFKKNKLVRLHRLKKRNSLFRYDVDWFYIPNYLEYDFVTLRSGIFRNPKVNESLYPFEFSISRLSAFYLSRGY